MSLTSAAKMAAVHISQTHSVYFSFPGRKLITSVRSALSCRIMEVFIRTSSSSNLKRRWMELHPATSACKLHRNSDNDTTLVKNISKETEFYKIMCGHLGTHF